MISTMFSFLLELIFFYISKYIIYAQVINRYMWLLAILFLINHHCPVTCQLPLCQVQEYIFSNIFFFVIIPFFYNLFFIIIYFLLNITIILFSIFIVSFIILY